MPRKLNNPFGAYIPEVSRIAAAEFQTFIRSESEKWKDATPVQKGKMFGVLVVQKLDDTYGYIGTNSGKLPGNATCDKFIPSLFDASIDDFFFDKGMTELTEICNQVNTSTNPIEIGLLKEKRKQKSIGLQKRLFENYNFINLSNKKKNLLDIFMQASNGIPPSAAGECAAPKLLQYAIIHQLKPIALSEFWWGNPSKNKERAHKVFYPACKNKCRPILEYMLQDSELFNRANTP